MFFEATGQNVRFLQVWYPNSRLCISAKCESLSFFFASEKCEYGLSNVMNYLHQGVIADVSITLSNAFNLQGTSKFSEGKMSAELNQMGLQELHK